MNLPMGISMPQAALVAIGAFLTFVYPHVEGKKKSKNSSLISKLGWVSLIGGVGWFGYQKFGNNNNKVTSNFAMDPNSIFPYPIKTSSFAPPVNNLTAASNLFSKQVDKLQPVDKYALIHYADTERRIPEVLSPLDVPSLGLSHETSGIGSNTIKVLA